MPHHIAPHDITQHRITPNQICDRRLHNLSPGSQGSIVAKKTFMDKDLFLPSDLGKDSIKNPSSFQLGPLGISSALWAELV